MTDKQVKIIKMMQELSVDGVLPSSQFNRNLYQMARLNFGSWEKAAAIAGLKTVRMYELEKLQATKNNARFYLDRFLIALRLAEKKRFKGENTIDNCMLAARKGLLDHYKII